jgi:multiple sugar transport system ATP-binding protein
MPITGLVNVTVVYPHGGTALHDVTLTAEQGEILAVLGPSGSGKSTMLRAVAGLVPTCQGEVFIGGRRVTDLPVDERGVAMVFESSTVIPFLDVSENIGWGLQIRRVPESEAAERVRVQARGLRLGRLLRRMPKTLSSGELSRVGIGHALVHAPTAFLFDEPLASLDAGQRWEVRRRIVDVVKRLDVSTLYVTHDQAEAMGVADRIALLNAGRIVQIDTPADLYHRPANIFAACFVGTPTIGLLPARLVISGGTGGFRVGARTLPLWTEPPGPLAALADRDLVIGVRPERVLDARDGSDPSAVTLLATVVRVEEIGPDAVVTLEVAAPAVTAPGTQISETGAAGGWGDVDSRAGAATGSSGNSGTGTATGSGGKSGTGTATGSSGIWGVRAEHRSDSGISGGQGRAWLRSRFRRNTTVRVGDTVPVAIDVTQAHVFDPATGRALWHPSS